MQVAAPLPWSRCTQNRYLRMDFGDRIHHVPEHDVVGVGPRAARGLEDDRRIDARGGIHDRQRLFHIVDVEGRHAVIVLNGVIEQLTQRDARHGLCSPCWAATPRPARLWCGVRIILVRNEH
jgi:hypothetical protein